MPSDVKRKLAAIMFTDIAGYTSQMSKDEAIAINLLNKKESILKPLIDTHNGTYVKSTGDGSLSYFNSAVDAAMCAKKFQESIYDDKTLNVRVGVHLGDTIFEDGDIRGDGVNIASRLESMSTEGGVFISKEVHDQLVNQKDFEGISLGLQNMKGVGRLIEVFGLKGKKLQEPIPNEYQKNEVEIHKDVKIPSLAIIPLKNRGSDEDIFYAYGISADLIKDCSGAGLIRVESLDRIEKIDNYNQLDIKDLASELSVRYILTGSLWKMKEIFQLSIELYDTKASKVLWSDRWQENWSNLSDIQNKLSDNITKVMNKTIIGKSNVVSSPEAYEYYLRGKHKYENRSNVEEIKIAQKLLSKSIELDENLIKARLVLGWSYYHSGDIENAINIYEIALEQARKTNQKPELSICLRRLGALYTDLTDDIRKSLDYTKKSLVIAEEIDDKVLICRCLNYKANLFSRLDYYLEALDCHTQTLELRKKIDQDSLCKSYHNIGHYYLWNVPNYRKALEYFNLSLDESHKVDDNEGIAFSLSAIAFANWLLGHYQEALKFWEESYNLFKKLGNKIHAAEQLIWTSIMHKELNHLDKSMDIIEKCSKIYEKVDSKNHKFAALATFCYIRKKLGLKYDISELEEYLTMMMKDKRVLHFVDWYFLYQITGNKEHLIFAYNRLNKISERVDSKLQKELFIYPMSKAIVKEWKNLNN